METLHIAGTNGKGSVAAYAANIFGQNHKTGMFTSPHLLDPTERFRMNGQPIGKLALSRYVAKSQQQREGVPFVHWTYAAKQWLEDEKAEYAVIETGIGGRLDMTNIFDSKVQVITSIGFDHTDLLGGTLREIASEKAGIIKPGSAVVTGMQRAEVMQPIVDAVNRTGSRLIMYNPLEVRDSVSGLDGQTFSYAQDGLDLKNVHLRSMAPGQIENACLAALAAHQMGMSPGEIRDGLESAYLPGRVELVTPDVLMDGGHNPAAMLELRRAVTRNFRGRGVIALFAAMKDKDIEGMAKNVDAFANEIYCTEVDSPRALRLPQYRRYFSSGVFIDNPVEAAEAAWDRARRNGDLLVVCGSFYLIKPAMKALGMI